MKLFPFSYKNVPVFAGSTINKIINSSDRELTIDASLGAGKIFISISRERDYIKLDNYRFKIARLLEVTRNKRRVYALVSGSIIPLSSIENNKFYQLVMFEGCKTPTVEISGIHMHKVLIDPLFEDSFLKIKYLDPKSHSKVLEICTGLGYTTYWLLKKKCRVVLSIEKSETILKLAEYNPWSAHLENVPIALGDATEIIHELEQSSFNYVIHDPPRFSLAPNLYSSEFYGEIFRVLKPGGKLLHYIGRPGHLRGKNIYKGVLDRLRGVGFVRTKYVGRIGSVIAKKPL